MHLIVLPQGGMSLQIIGVAAKKFEGIQRFDRKCMFMPNKYIFGKTYN